MYQPAHFAETRLDALHAFVREHPLGLLVTLDAAGRPRADALPFLLEPGGACGMLRGHVARANPLWRDTRFEVEALVVFQGEHGYVSPAWYPSKAEHGKVVPTWNYRLVQARGRLRAVEDAAWLRDLVGRLTARFEGERRGGPPPWQVADAPEDYVQSMLRAIVGIEIELGALEGKFKLGQNRTAGDRAGVVAGLEAQGDAAALALAALMGRG